MPLPLLIKDRTGLYANGSDSYITVPSYTIPASFSIAFWYSPRKATLNDRVVDNQDAGPTNGFTFIHTVANNPNISFIVCNDVTSVANIQATNMRFQKWHFIVATYTQNSVKLFVNGVQQGATDSSATITAATNQIHIGKRAGGSNFAQGRIDDFMFFSKVLSNTEIELLSAGFSPAALSGLDIWYKIDEISGTSIADSSGNGRTGTRSGSSAANPTVFFTEPGLRMNRNARSNDALSFARLTSAVVTVADTSSLRPETTSTFSWAAWIILNNTNENVLPRICEKGSHFFCFMGDQTNGKGNQLALEVANNDSSTTEYWGSTRLQRGRPYHVAVTFDGTGAGDAQIYVNGIKEAMQIKLGPYSELKSTSGSDFKIGNRTTLSRNLSGALSDFRMHNVVLTQSEIQQIFRGEAVTRGLVGKWNFDEATGTTLTDSSGGGHNGTATGSPIWINY